MRAARRDRVIVPARTVRSSAWHPSLQPARAFFVCEAPTRLALVDLPRDTRARPWCALGRSSRTRAAYRPPHLRDGGAGPRQQPEVKYDAREAQSTNKRPRPRDRKPTQFPAAVLEFLPTCSSAAAAMLCHWSCHCQTVFGDDFCCCVVQTGRVVASALQWVYRVGRRRSGCQAF